MLEARADGDGVALEVWGPTVTPRQVREHALAAAAAWAGLTDDVHGEFAEAVCGHAVLRRLYRRLGAPRLSRLPRVGEALGRAVLGQLVQTVEARRSTAQVAAMLGIPSSHELWCWPTARQIGAAPAWRLRGCGVSLHGSRALHAGAVSEPRLVEACGDWPLLDRRLRALPGVGLWTSAETRLALGDPDALSLGDYHLPALMGFVLAGEPTDDAGMLELLAPYHGQRGRLVKLVVAGLVAGMVRRPPRRGPRAARSQHRYW